MPSDAAPTADLDIGRRAFVTGGSGFIGHLVVQMLLEAGLEVTCLLLPDDGAPLLEDKDIVRVRGDLGHEEELAALLEGHDVVFHLAAIYALWMKRPARMWEVNVDGTRRLMRAARDAGVRRVVHTSSIAAVGHREGQALSDEETAFNDWAVADDYVLSKYISEKEALSHDGDGLEVVAVNPSFPFGHGDLGPTPTGRLILATLEGMVPFWTRGGFNAVDVRDVALGHLLAAAHGRPGERYLLSGENVTFKEFGRRVAAAAGVRPAFFQAPVAALKAVGHAEVALAELVGRPPLMTPKSIAYTAGRFTWFDHRKAREELGYEPRPLDGALRASIAWFRHRIDAGQA